MNAVDWGILSLLALGVFGICIHLIRRKKAGKGGCGGGCANCPVAGRCKGKGER